MKLSGQIVCCSETPAVLSEPPGGLQKDGRRCAKFLPHRLSVSPGSRGWVWLLQPLLFIASGSPAPGSLLSAILTFAGAESHFAELRGGCVGVPVATVAGNLGFLFECLVTLGRCLGGAVSGFWLGLYLIGRPRDAYRKEDILRFFLHLMELYGKPLVIRLERGIWASLAIRGKGTAYLAPEDLEAHVCGGLRALGIELQYCDTPKAKGEIETGFGYVQKAAEGMIENVPSYGRLRGERSRDGKAIQRARSGQVHPRDVGVPSHEEMGKLMHDVLAFCNRWPKEGRIQKGIPEVRWQEGIAASPLRPLKAEERHIFLPERRELNIRAGSVSTKIKGEQFRFTSELFAQLGDGYRVKVCFDPTVPQDGAEILNYTTGAENVKRYGVNEFICRADFMRESPLFSRVPDENVTRKKNFTRAVNAYFAAIGISGQTGPSLSEKRDGRGGVNRVARGRDFAGTEKGNEERGNAAERLLNEARAAKQSASGLTKEEKAKRFQETMRSLDEARERGEILPA